MEARQEPKDNWPQALAHLYTQAAVPHNSTDMLTTPKYKIDYIKKIRNSSLKWNSYLIQACIFRFGWAMITF
jgi:hypothetical protein